MTDPSEKRARMFHEPRKMAEADTLKNMVLSFRVSELQMLLGFAGRNRHGRKNELQARAVDLLRLQSTSVQQKIKELYKSIQQQNQANSMMPLQQCNTTPMGGTTAAIHNTPMQAQIPQRGPVFQPGVGYTSSATDRQMQGQQAPRNMYPNNMGYQYQPKVSPVAASPSSSYPVHPDVRLRRLPFYDMMGELLKPSSLAPRGTQRVQESNFVFHLTPQQATDIAISRDLRPGSKLDYAVQVQTRFCLLETTCEQEDCFPPGVCLKVNGKICPLPNPIPTNRPGVEPKRPPRPVNVTPLVKLSPTVSNHITVTWNTDSGRGYVVACYLVRKLSSFDLLHRMKTKGIRHSDFTKGLIKEKLNEDADCEIATTSLRVSLVCPLGKIRMANPCRASTCYHLQCFDASLYLQMNEKKPSWMCPVCDKPALYDNLVIDGYFQQVLLSGKLSDDGNEIELYQDGSWASLAVKKDKSDTFSTDTPEKPKVKHETVSDDLEVIQATVPNSNAAKKDEPKKKESTVVDLTLSDSEDEADAAKKTPASNKPELSSQVVKPTPVSNSGYGSPSVITLDSPSPPPASSPTPPPPPAQPVPVDPLPAPIPPPAYPSSLYMSSYPMYQSLGPDMTNATNPMYQPRY